MNYFVHCKIFIIQIFFENKDYAYNLKFKIQNNVFN